MKVLVIGATSAIAVAVQRIYAKKEAELFLVGRSEEKLQQTSADLLSLGAKSVDHFIMDATEVSSHSNMLDQCVLNLGQIDVALIAHGTLPDQERCETDVEYALEEFTNNGTSVIALLTLLAQQFEKQRCGTMAVISSVAGDRGRPSNYLYGSAKSAVTSFCEGLRGRMFKLGVHLMTIKPGFVDTPMTQGLDLPKPLVATPEKVAEAIVRGVNAKSNTIYTPWFWQLIMLIVKHIPQGVFKRLSM